MEGNESRGGNMAMLAPSRLLQVVVSVILLLLISAQAGMRVQAQPAATPAGAASPAATPPGATLSATPPATAPAAAAHQIRVLNAAGAPIAYAEAALLPADSTVPRVALAWTRAVNGVVTLPVPGAPAAGTPFALLVRAVGYAPVICQAPAAAGAKVHDVRLQPGRRVKLHLEAPIGSPSPGTPGTVKVYTCTPLDLSLAARDGDGLFPLEPAGTDTYALTVAQDTPPLFVQTKFGGTPDPVQFGPLTPGAEEAVAVDISKPGTPISALAAAASIAASAATGAPPAPSASEAVLAKLRGDHRVFVRVRAPSGNPVTGRGYKLVAQVPGGPPAVLAQGMIPQTGLVDLQNLAGGDLPPSYVFMVENFPVGIVRLDGPSRMRDVSFVVPTNVGSTAPDVALTDSASRAVVLPSQYRGQFLLLDFWATWCGPCRQTMPMINDIARRRGGEWAGKVAFVAASIDDGPDAPLKLAAQSGWTAMRQVWCSPGGWGSAATKQFGVRGIPHAVLVDPAGRIVWSGHPGGVNLESLIAKNLGK